MTLADFDTREIEFGRYLWFCRDYPALGPVAQQSLLAWERLKPEVQVEFCRYARAIRQREFRGGAN